MLGTVPLSRFFSGELDHHLLVLCVENPME